MIVWPSVAPLPLEQNNILRNVLPNAAKECVREPYISPKLF